jgi:hypothetical protein
LHAERTDNHNQKQHKISSIGYPLQYNKAQMKMIICNSKIVNKSPYFYSDMAQVRESLIHLSIWMGIWRKIFFFFGKVVFWFFGNTRIRILCGITVFSNWTCVRWEKFCVSSTIRLKVFIELSFLSLSVNM